LSNKIVLDTNILLETPEILGEGEKVTYVIPAVVLKELDDLKRKRKDLSYSIKLAAKSILKNIEKIEVDFSDYVLSSNDEKIIEVAKKHGTLYSADLLVHVYGKTQKINVVNPISYLDEDYTGYVICQVKDEYDDLIQHIYSKEGSIPETIAHKYMLERVDDGNYVVFLLGDNELLFKYKKNSALYIQIKHPIDNNIKTFYPKDIYQTMAYLSASNPNVPMTIIDGVVGSGKAQPVSALVFDKKGAKYIGDVKPNDFVLSEKGEEVRVISVHPQGLQDIYKVTFSDGTYAECTLDHLWSIQTIRDRTSTERNYDRIQTKTLKEILELGLIDKKGQNKFSIPMTEPVNFTEKNLLIDPYTLGLYLAEGHSQKNSFQTCIYTNDKEIINYIKLPKNNFIEEKTKTKFKYSIKLIDKKKKDISFYGFLKVYKLNGKKAEEKFIPDEYLYSSLHSRLELMKGLFDGDGYISKNGFTIEYSTVSEKLKNQIVFLINSIGGTVTVSERQGSYKKNGEKIFTKKNYRLFVKSPLNVFKLTRKASRFKIKEKYPIRRFITNVEKVRTENAVCLFLDNPSHLYLTNNFIVTHNTLLALAAAISLVEKNKFEKIYISRPPIGIDSRYDIGYLPGMTAEKLNPWVGGILSNLEFMYGEKANELFDTYFKHFPVNMAQGYSIHKSVLLVDEAQLLSVDIMKQLISRIAEGSKLIIMGDDAQTYGIVSQADSGFRRIRNILPTEYVEYIKLQKIYRGPLSEVAMLLDMVR